MIIMSKYGTIVFLYILSMVTDASAMFTMGAKHKITPDQRQKALKAIETLRKVDIPTAKGCRPDQILLYPEDENPIIKGVCFSENIFDLSNLIKNQMEDLGGKENILGMKIPLACSFGAIKDSRDILIQYDKAKSQDVEKDALLKKNAVKEAIQSYSFQQLVDVANCLSYLECPDNINKVIVDVMKEKLFADSKCLDGVNFNLYFDLKIVALDPLINWVRNLFIAKNMKDKNNKEILAQRSGFPQTQHILYNASYHLNVFKDLAIDLRNNIVIYSQNNNVIAFNLKDKTTSTINLPDVHISFPILDNNVCQIIPSTDCKYIAYAKNGVIPCIQDISSHEKTEFSTNEDLADKQIQALSFNHNNTQLAVSYGSLVIGWDIKDPKNPKFIIRCPTYFFSSISFSADDKKIAIGRKSRGIYSVNIYNVSDGEHIKTLDAETLGGVSKVVFAPNGERIIASGYETTRHQQDTRTKYFDENNLITWNIKDIQKPSFQNLNYVLKDRKALIVSSDGKMMITGGSKKNPNVLELWDLSNDDNITHQTIAHLESPCNSLALSDDGTTLISGDGIAKELTGYKTSLILWRILTKEQKEVVGGIKLYDTDRVRLLLQLYLKENVTNPEILKELPQQLQDVLPKSKELQGVPPKSPASSSGSSWFSWFNNLFSRFQFYTPVKTR